MMLKDKDYYMEQLIGLAEDIIEQIVQGNDVEVRKAPGGGLKVLVVRKQVLSGAERQ